MANRRHSSRRLTSSCSNSITNSCRCDMIDFSDHGTPAPPPKAKDADRMRQPCPRTPVHYLPGPYTAGGERAGVRGASVRVDDRAQHDAALLGVVVARTPVHRRALVPDQEIADLPRMVVGEAFLGGVSGELLDQLPRLCPFHPLEAMRVHWVDEQDRAAGDRMVDHRRAP